MDIKVVSLFLMPPEEHRARDAPGRPAGPGAWTVRFVGAREPESVTIDGKAAPAGSWSWDAASRVLTVKVAERPTSQSVDVAYRYR